MRHDSGFYRSRAWREFRLRYLAEHPLCAVPGCGQLAQHVDHIQSRASGGDDFGPVQGLCVPHHSQKSVATDGGFGNRRGGDWQPTIKGSNADGSPRANDHPWNQPDK